MEKWPKGGLICVVKNVVDGREGAKKKERKRVKGIPLEIRLMLGKWRQPETKSGLQLHACFPHIYPSFLPPYKHQIIIIIIIILLPPSLLLSLFLIFSYCEERKHANLFFQQASPHISLFHRSTSLLFYISSKETKNKVSFTTSNGVALSQSSFNP